MCEAGLSANHSPYDTRTLHGFLRYFHNGRKQYDKTGEAGFQEMIIYFEEKGEIPIFG